MFIYLYFLCLVLGFCLHHDNCLNRIVILARNLFLRLSNIEYVSIKYHFSSIHLFLRFSNLKELGD